MLSPKLYKNSHAYDLFMRVFGFEASVERFLRATNIPPLVNGNILDNGCGSGTIGIHFLQASEQTTLLSTDLEPNFLDAALKKAKRRGIDGKSMSVGTANITAPDQVQTLDGHQYSLNPESFQLVCIGAVLGYSQDPSESLRTLVRLLAPGGFFFNLEMSETALGKYVCKRYHYDNISIEEMKAILRDEGCSVSQITMNLKYFPSCMTRTALIAQKR